MVKKIKFKHTQPFSTPIKFHNQYNNTYPIIYHGNSWGRKHKFWKYMTRHVHRLPIKTNSDILLITANNRPELGILEKQILKSGIEYLNICKGISPNDYKNFYKILMFDKYRSEILKYKYFLFMDSYDVIINGDLSKCINILNQYNTSCITCAEYTNFPRSSPTKDWENRTFGSSRFPYLNSGVIFADSCGFYQDIYPTLKDNLQYTNKSDQKVWKITMKELYPKIRIDNMCEVFQSFCRYGKKGRIINGEKEEN